VIILIANTYLYDSVPDSTNKGNKVDSIDNDQFSNSPSRIDSLQPENIIEAIRSLPPLQRENAIQPYVGIKVRWQCQIGTLSRRDKLSHGPTDTNLVWALLRSNFHNTIVCYLDPDKHPGLSLVREGDTVIVEGTISGYDNLAGIELEEAHLIY